MKAISAGYFVKVGGVGSSITLANGAELGIIESSAYPLHADIYSQSGESSGIFIEGTSYSGMLGVISALRESVWMHSPTINLMYDYDFDVKTHNGKPYNFYSQKDQGIEAHKDVCLYGDSINLARSRVKAGQDAWFSFINQVTNSVATHSSYIQAGNTISVNHGAWEADTQTVFSGSDGSSTIQNPADLTPNSH